jgi:hypothetical protein
MYLKNEVFNQQFFEKFLSMIQSSKADVGQGIFLKPL